jgi:hypothetical protein
MSMPTTHNIMSVDHSINPLSMSPDARASELQMRRDHLDILLKQRADIMQQPAYDRARIVRLDSLVGHIKRRISNLESCERRPSATSPMRMVPVPGSISSRSEQPVVDRDRPSSHRPLAALHIDQPLPAGDDWEDQVERDMRSLHARIAALERLMHSR